MTRWSHQIQVVGLRKELQGYPKPGKHQTVHFQRQWPGFLAGLCPKVKNQTCFQFDDKQQGDLLYLKWSLSAIVNCESLTESCISHNCKIVSLYTMKKAKNHIPGSSVCKAVMEHQPDIRTLYWWGCTWGRSHRCLYRGKPSLCRRRKSHPNSALGPPSHAHRY